MTIAGVPIPEAPQRCKRSHSESESSSEGDETSASTGCDSESEREDTVYYDPPLPPCPVPQQLAPKKVYPDDGAGSSRDSVKSGNGASSNGAVSPGNCGSPIHHYFSNV